MLPADDPRDTATLIADIETRFHEGHRRDLARLVALAGPLSPPLAEHLRTMAKALELHMFKEEARLFPMLLQGGHSLVGLLIADLSAEHRAHEQALDTLLGLMECEPLPPVLRQGLQHFIDELRAHVVAEDELLFPRFPHSPGLRTGRQPRDRFATCPHR